MKAKKYLYIAKSEFLSNAQYVSTILLSFIGYLVLIFIFINLWNYMYDSPDELIRGYSKGQMIWYVIFTEILWSCTGGRRLCRKIVNDVRSGNIAYNMNKPYSYISFILWSHLGEISIKLIIYVLLSFTIGFIYLHYIPFFGFNWILMIIIASIFSLIINILLVTAIGLFSFIIEDSNPLFWLYSKVILLIGTIFPIEFFPQWIQPILKYSPIYVLTYGPAKLFVDFTLQEGINILIAQIIYTIIGYTICLLIYNKGVRKLNVNGG